MSSTGLSVETLNAQLMALLGKAQHSLDGGIPLEQVGYWGGSGGQNMRIYSPAPFPISVFFLLSIKMLSVPTTWSYCHEFYHAFPSTLACTLISQSQDKSFLKLLFLRTW